MLVASASPAGAFRVSCRDGVLRLHVRKGDTARYLAACDVDRAANGFCAVTVSEDNPCVECESREPTRVAVHLDGRRRMRQAFSIDGARLVVTCRRSAVSPVPAL